jgi:hypothetical protein
MSTSTVNVTVKETDWVIGDMNGGIVHAAATKRDCQDWIAEKHRLLKRPAGHKLVEGVYQVAAVDCTYWLMADAQTARDNGYPIPLPETGDTYGLAKGQCALFNFPTGPALVWNRATDGRINREPVPLGRLADADVWVERMCGRLRNLSVVTEYVGRREV